MATRQNQVIFPISQEHMQPNMLRYPKDKILYITIESDVDCCPSIAVQHNKKEEAVIAVTSMVNSQNANAKKLDEMRRNASDESLRTDDEVEGSDSKPQAQQ